ncbi:phage portal protein [Roseibacillus persicicus]|uniref:phage portal protein n=1 Tax=Roseibacillus persicicus TaxID=454148 RepID=UPI00398AEBD0
MPFLDPKTGLIHKSYSSAHDFGSQGPSSSLSLSGEGAQFTLSQDKAAPHPFLTGDDGGSSYAPSKTLSDPYADSPWIFAGIHILKGPILPLEAKLTTADREGNDVEYSHPDLTTFFRCPAYDHSGYLNETEFRDLLITYRLLYGNAFVVLPPEWAARAPSTRNRPVPLLAHPSHMRPQRDGSGRLVAWKYTGMSGASDLQATLPPEQVIQWKSFNSQDQIVGMPEWWPARIDAAADSAAATYAKHLAESNGDRGDWVIAEDWLTDDQLQQTKAILRRKKMMNRRGDYEPLILGGIKDIKAPATAATNADFSNQRLQNRHVVAITLGIPASMFDVTASYSIGAASDYLRLILQSCQPLAAGLAEVYEQLIDNFQNGTDARLSAKLNRSISVAFDWSSNPVIQEVRREKISTGKELWATGLPWEVISQHLDLDLPEFPGWEVGYLPFNVTPVESPRRQPAAPDPTPAEGEGNEVDRALSEIDKAFSNPANLAALKDAAREPLAKAFDDTLARVHDKAERERRDHLRAANLRIHSLYEEAFTKALKRSLYNSRAQALENLARFAPTMKSKGLDKGLVEQLLNVADLVANLVKGLGPITANAVRQAALEEWENLGMDPAAPNSPHGSDDPNAPEPLDPVIAQALQTRRNRVKDMAEDLHRDMQEEVNSGLAQGEGHDQIADRLRSFFKEEESHRAKTVAITETTFALETGRTAARQRANVKFKEWLTSDDDKVRHSHKSIDGQIVPADQPFNLGGGIALMHPGEDGGPPQEVINCRCQSIASPGPPRHHLED